MAIDNTKQLDSIKEIMKDFAFSWLISGGWAIDLGIGKITREHEDMDICIFRENTQDILAYFSDWDIKITVPGEHCLESVTSIEDTKFPRYGLHLFKDDQFIEILLTDIQDGKIPFRRDSSIQIEIDQFVKTDDVGRKFVTPEYQLLFKAKEGREKDNHDFFAYLPVMTSQQKVWLLAALEKHVPSSPWIIQLQTT